MTSEWRYPVHRWIASSLEHKYSSRCISKKQGLVCLFLPILCAWVFYVGLLVDRKRTWRGCLKVTGRKVKSRMIWSKDQHDHQMQGKAVGWFQKWLMTSCQRLAILCSCLPCGTAQWLRTLVLVWGGSRPSLHWWVSALCLTIFPVSSW